MKSTNELENATRDLILLLAFDSGLASKALETIQLEEQTGRLSNEEAVYMFKYTQTLYEHLSSYHSTYPENINNEPAVLENDHIQTYTLKERKEETPASVKKSLLQKLLNR